MAAIVRNETLDPSKLTEEQLEGWIDRLYGVHCEIFDGVSRDEFARYVVRSTADRTTLQISYGADDELAGYIAVHAFRRTFRDEPCTVVRAEAGLRRAFRGDGAPGSFFASQLLKARLDFPGALYYLGCLVHPSSYTALARDAAAIWPNPAQDIPDDVLAFMMALGEEFHLEVVDPSRPLVRHVGWITRDTEVERQYWLNCAIEAPRFYVEQNPGFVHGHGLLTLVPMDLASMSRGLASWGSGRLKKSLRRTLGTLERTVLRPNLADWQAEQVLSHVEGTTGLSLDALRALRGVGTRYPVSARTVLFRAGERGDALYFVVSGSLVVLELDASGQELIIDQLGPGYMAGEMAVMTGRPRTATVRAATDAVLVRLTRADLDAIFAAQPELEDTLWRYIGRRVFDERARSVPSLGAFGHLARLAWADAGASRALDEDEELVLDNDQILVLSNGQVVTEGPAGWSSLSAPAALSLPVGTRITAIEAARIALLPPR